MSTTALTATEEKNITDNVFLKIKSFRDANEIKLPDNYSVENACRNAFLILSEQTTRDNKPVLQACTKASIANALLKMAIQGLSPVKNQCYFIPYGDKLTCQRSYHGSISLAKRVSTVKDISANVVYQEDVFEYEINTETGKVKVLKHEQKIENIDLGKIKGAYATLILEDGTTETTIMTYPQIMNAWKQGTMKGNSGAHNNFTDEMAKKTVINRACKDKINTSNDSDLYDDEEQAPNTPQKEEVKTEIKDNANKGEEISFEEVPAQEEKTNETVENTETVKPTGQTEITDFN